MEDVLTETPPPSRFFQEDLDNFAALPPPLLLLNLNFSLDHPPYSAPPHLSLGSLPRNPPPGYSQGPHWFPNPAGDSSRWQLTRAFSMRPLLLHICRRKSSPRRCSVPGCSRQGRRRCKIAAWGDPGGEGFDLGLNLEPELQGEVGCGRNPSF